MLTPATQFTFPFHLKNKSTTYDPTNQKQITNEITNCEPLVIYAHLNLSFSRSESVPFFLLQTSIQPAANLGHGWLPIAAEETPVPTTKEPIHDVS